MAESRIMTADDIEFGLQLCRLSNWNQTPQDWTRLLQLQSDGLFIAECDGRPCGTASTTAYGNQSAWIGMILVHPDFRRRGIGSTLMTRCIQYLQQKQVQSIKLDATDQGRPVYLKLGFRDERAINRYCRPAAPLSSPNLHHNDAIGDIADADWPEIAEIDQPAFGANRLQMLKLLARDGRTAIIKQNGRTIAYGFSRPGHLADYLGPIVALQPDAARKIALHLLNQMTTRDVFWDLMPDNRPALQLAHELGFAEVRSLMRMYLGQTMNPGQVEQLFAAADFALG